MSTKRQIGSDGKRKLAPGGKQEIGGTCCCGPGCSNSCQVQFESTYNCISAWSTPAIINRKCSGTNVTGWTADPADCLHYTGWFDSSNVPGCCTNDAHCATATATVAPPCPTNRLSPSDSLALGCPPDCFDNAPPGDCTDCCDYDVTILTGCSAGTYRISKASPPAGCLWFVSLNDVDPTLRGQILLECSCGTCDSSAWSMAIQSVDTTDGVDPLSGTCFDENCLYELCSSHACTCYCPPVSGWVACDADKNCTSTVHATPTILVSMAC